VLSFASLTQVGIIVAEIGLGFRYVALIHLLGHACLRALQFIRAPSLLLDYKAVENAIGGKLPREDAGPASAWQLGFYRFAIERGYLDAILADYVARPFTGLFRGLTRLETAWMLWLNGPGQTAEPVEIVRVPAIPPVPELAEAPS